MRVKTKCTVCDGEGRIKSEYNEYNSWKCSECDGTGVEPSLIKVAYQNISEAAEDNFFIAICVGIVVLIGIVLPITLALFWFIFNVLDWLMSFVGINLIG